MRWGLSRPADSRKSGARRQCGQERALARHSDAPLLPAPCKRARWTRGRGRWVAPLTEAPPTRPARAASPRYRPPRVRRGRLAAIFLGDSPRRRRRMEPGGGRRERLPPPTPMPAPPPPRTKEGPASSSSRGEKAKQRAAQQELKQRQRAEVGGARRVGPAPLRRGHAPPGRRGGALLASAPPGVGECRAQLAGLS